MRINSISNNKNVSFNGWRSWSKESDAKKIATDYEMARKRFPYDMSYEKADYTFDDVAEIFKWLDKNTPDYDIYIDKHPSSGFGVIVAQNKNNFNDKLGYAIDESRTANGNYYYIDGFKKMKNYMVKIYSEGGPKLSPYEERIKAYEEQRKQEEIEQAEKIQNNLNKLL